MEYFFSGYKCPFLKKNYLHPNYYSLLFTILMYLWTFLMILPAILTYKINVYGTDIYENELKGIQNKFGKKEDEKFWIATIFDDHEKKEILAGTLSLQNMSEKNRSEFSMAPENKVAFINNVGVHSEHRKFGIASKLMQTAVDFARAKKYEYATLNVLEISAPAISLYKKFGMYVVYQAEKLRILGLNNLGMLLKLE